MVYEKKCYALPMKSILCFS